MRSASHADRNAQFEYLNAAVVRFQKRGQPAISVDTKKKELVGDFCNGGREWRPQGQPEEVRVHDFLDKTLGKAIPYGVYDVLNNQGWVSVGIDHDTGQSITWDQMFNSDFQFVADIDHMAFDTPAPIHEGPDGVYPRPLPGLTKEY